MTEIINAIDAWSETYLTDYQRTLFGFCELMKKTAKDSVQPMPVTIPDRIQVALNDKKEVLTWIRLVDPVSSNPSEEHQWGAYETEEFTANLRLVFAHKTTLGEDLIFDFASNIPESFIIPEYTSVFLTINEILTDHEAIYMEELGDTVYERHRFTWNLYAVNIAVKFIKCTDYSDYRITESGNFRITE